MKIFAKRTKKKAESSAPRTVNKSDPVVEELLKKDPSEWNAKERRMIKRYRERKAQETNEQIDTKPANEVNKTEGVKNAAQNEDAKQEDSDGDDSSSSSDSEENNDVEDEAEIENDGNSSIDDSEVSNKIETLQTTSEQVDEIRISDKEETVDNNTKVPKDHEIWSVLEKLNSKQKRTLSRKLDRMGISGLDEVEEEANKILDMTMLIDVDSKRDKEEVTSTDNSAPNESTEPKKKKRKKAADWSSLPAEERLRREEQRKKQQEAAERRARGESIKPGHRRPLNSARRRANRRKPKWASKSPSNAPDISDYKREHHSSGFLHRKTPGQVASNH